MLSSSRQLALTLYHAYHDAPQRKRTPATHAFLEPMSLTPMLDRVRDELGELSKAENVRLREAIFAHADELAANPRGVPTLHPTALVGELAYMRTLAAPTAGPDLCSRFPTRASDHNSWRPEYLPMLSAPVSALPPAPRYTQMPRDAHVLDVRGVSVDRGAALSALEAFESEQHLQSSRW